MVLQVADIESKNSIYYKNCLKKKNDVFLLLIFIHFFMQVYINSFYFYFYFFHLNNPKVAMNSNFSNI